MTPSEDLVTTARPRPSPATPPGRTIAAKIVTQCLRLALVLWPIVIAVTLGIPTLVDRLGGHTGSIYPGVAQAPRWFLFVIAIVLVAEGLGPHVALGMTRRSFARQHAAGLAVVAAVYGALSLAVTLLERWFFERLGWPLETVYGQRPVPTDPWPLVWVDHAVLLAVFALSGLAVGAVYYRWRGWIGTLALPFTVGPVFLAATALVHVDAADTAAVLDLDGLPYVAGLGVAVVVGGWFWGIARLALRAAAIRTPAST